MIIDLMEKVKEVSKIDEQKIKNALQFVIGSLKKIKFQDTEWPSVKFHSFGSQGNGFGTTSSDIDISLMTDHYTPEVPGLNFIFKNLREITENQCKIVFIRDARVPFITISYKGQDVDIIMNNLLGIINTKLLKSYSLLHEKVKAGGILLKLWGKKNKVIDKPLISSYALILMWLCFLQRKYDLPDLQDQKYISTLDYKSEDDYMLTVRRKVREDDECFKTDPRFIYYKEPLFQELQQKCQNLNNVRIEQLLQEFWQYYSFDVFTFRKISTPNNLISIKIWMKIISWQQLIPSIINIIQENNQKKMSRNNYL
ncbi:hypothetical protein pb186bvf_020113 [Paramecium bursaria]